VLNALLILNVRPCDSYSKFRSQQLEEDPRLKENAMATATAIPSSVTSFTPLHDRILVRRVDETE
jgi:hypothetical protein